MHEQIECNHKYIALPVFVPTTSTINDEPWYFRNTIFYFMFFYRFHQNQSLFENSSWYRISNAIKPVQSVRRNNNNIYSIILKRREKNPIANENNHFICFGSDVISDDTQICVSYYPKQNKKIKMLKQRKIRKTLVMLPIEHTFQNTHNNTIIPILFNQRLWWTWNKSIFRYTSVHCTLECWCNMYFEFLIDFKWCQAEYF